MYGEDCYDGGGVYGADFVNEGPTQPVVITKIERRQSKESESAKQQQHSIIKETTASSTAKSSRKQSKDTTIAADLEKAYLISAANECHNGEEANMSKKHDVTAVETQCLNNQQPSIGAPEMACNYQHQQKHAKFSANDTQILLNNKPLKSTTNNYDNGQTQLLSQSTIPSSISGFSMNTSVTTPRKPAFNPLHVILKDKNKYHTTEYI